MTTHGHLSRLRHVRASSSPRPNVRPRPRDRGEAPRTVATKGPGMFDRTLVPSATAGTSAVRPASTSRRAGLPHLILLLAGSCMSVLGAVLIAPVLPQMIH